MDLMMMTLEILYVKLYVERRRIMEHHMKNYIYFSPRYMQEILITVHQPILEIEVRVCLCFPATVATFFSSLGAFFLYDSYHDFVSRRRVSLYVKRNSYGSPSVNTKKNVNDGLSSYVPTSCARFVKGWMSFLT